MKPGDLEDILISRILHFAQKCGAVEYMNIRAAQNLDYGESSKGHYH
jgi:hypothetical protein